MLDEERKTMCDILDKWNIVYHDKPISIDIRDFTIGFQPSNERDLDLENCNEVD